MKSGLTDEAHFFKTLLVAHVNHLSHIALSLLIYSRSFGKIHSPSLQCSRSSSLISFVKARYVICPCGFGSFLFSDGLYFCVLLQ
jgi:hypothetical protein